MKTSRVNPIPRKKTVKHYELYGESEPRLRQAALTKSQTGAWTNSFHYETIPYRSRQYQWEIEPHVHDAFLQILMISQGQASVRINGVERNLSAPHLIVIPAQNVHSFRFSSDVDGPVITVAQQALEALANILLPSLNHALRQPWVISLGQDRQADESVWALLAAIEREWRMHAQGQAAAGLSLLATLLIHLSRYPEVLAQSQQKLSDAPNLVALTRAHTTVEKFKRLVNEKFKTPFSIDAYAQRLGVSSGQLTRLCKQSLGSTASDVINARLVFEAQRELTYTSDSVKKIAANLGFEDEAYFSRFFKKHTGLSPLGFRRQEG
jgi:AraC family transcriptional activator of pobA